MKVVTERQGLNLNKDRQLSLVVDGVQTWSSLLCHREVNQEFQIHMERKGFVTTIVIFAKLLEYNTTRVTFPLICQPNFISLFW